MLLGAGDTPGHVPTAQTEPPHLRFPQRPSYVPLLGGGAATLAWEESGINETDCSLTWCSETL